jgi:hypothetical protein
MSKISNCKTDDEFLAALRHPAAYKGVQYDIVFNHSEHGLVALSMAENDMNDSWMWWWTSDVDNSMYAGDSVDSCYTIIKNIRKRHEVLLCTFPTKKPRRQD